MKAQDIDKLIASLGKEIRQITDEVHRDDALIRLQDIARTYAGEDKLITSSELADEILSRPEQEKILCGMGGLDDIIGGFREGQLVVLSGITKHGKTNFAVHLTGQMKSYEPLWIPFEGSATELVERFLDRGERPPHFVTPRVISGNTLDWIEKKIIEGKAKYGSKVAFIDHLHFIDDIEGGNDNLAHRLSKIMRSLKRLAVKWGICIFILVHVRKAELDRVPDLSELKDSSAIAQEADLVMFVWRETYRDENDELIITNNGIISVQANRRTGKTGNVKVTCVKGQYLEQYWKESKPGKGKKRTRAEIDEDWSYRGE